MSVDENEEGNSGEDSEEDELDGPEDAASDSENENGDLSDAEEDGKPHFRLPD